MRRLIAALFGLGLGAVALVAPAQASFDDCYGPTMCIVDGTGGTGEAYMWYSTDIWSKPGHCLNLTGGQNNMADVAVNSTQVQMRLFDGADCTTDSSHPGYFTFPAGYFKNFANTPGMLNKTSSIYSW